MQFLDLTPYTYGTTLGECLNIGWIGDTITESDQPVTDDVIAKLKFASNLSGNMHAGLYWCQLCKSIDKTSRKQSSCSVFIVPSTARKGANYICPELLIHYCLVHKYRPPEEFIESVLTMNDEINPRNLYKSVFGINTMWARDDYRQKDYPIVDTKSTLKKLFG